MKTAMTTPTQTTRTPTHDEILAHYADHHPDIIAGEWTPSAVLGSGVQDVSYACHFCLHLEFGIRSGLQAEYGAALTAEIEMATGAPTHTADVRPGTEMISEMRPVLTDANDTESTSKFFV
jgi:hypothetical protein